MLLLAAVVGVGVCAAMVWNNPARLWPAYLYGFLACWLVSVGAMGLLALGNLTGGRWAIVGRPFYLAATQSIWFVAISVCADRCIHRTHLPVGKR